MDDNSLEARIAKLSTSGDKIVDKCEELPCVKEIESSPAVDKSLTDKQKDKIFVKEYVDTLDCGLAAMRAYDIKDSDLAFVRGNQARRKFKKKIDELLYAEINEKNVKIDIRKISKMAEKWDTRLKALEALGRYIGLDAKDKVPESSFTWQTLVINANTEVAKEKLINEEKHGATNLPTGNGTEGEIQQVSPRV